MLPRKLFPILLCLAFSSLAQDRGTITGIITDATGSTAPGAVVTVKNPATGLIQTAQTGGDGTFSLPYLPVGLYTVSTEKAGFRTVQAADIQVSVNSVARVDMQLQVGEVQQVVQVEAIAPLLQTDRTDLGKVLTSKTILDLPLSLAGGLRNNLQFVLLTPGVTVTPGDNQQMRIGGGLANGHSMLLDGAEANSERRGDPNFQAISTDAIEEFKVQTGAYSAEYGRTSNGIINFTTKSGTNAVHGSAFEFFRNNALNARGFYPARRQVTRQNTYGGSAGGPVYLPKLFDGRNKAFFFFAYEKAIFRSGSPSSLSSVPPEAFRRGDFREWRDNRGGVIPIYDPATTRVESGRVVRDQFQCGGQLNVICPDRIHPIANRLNSLIPVPTRASLFDNIATLGNPGNDQDVASVKGDYIFSSKSRTSGLFSRQYFGSPEQIGPIAGPLGSNFAASGTNKFYRLNHDYIFSPSLLNHFTFGKNGRLLNEFFPRRFSSTDLQSLSVKGAPPNTILPAYNIGEYGSLNNTQNTFAIGDTWNINEQIAWLKGRHSLKFGFYFIRQNFHRVDNRAASVSFGAGLTGLPSAPSQTGSGYAAFLLGLASAGGYKFPNNDFSWGAPYYAWFAQDDFKVTNKLTLNLGMRYDIALPKSEKDGRQSNLCLHCPNPAAGNILGAMQFAGDGPGRTGQKRFTDTRYNGFGPRLGIAYRIFSKTVARAGGGIFYQSWREGTNADRMSDGFGGDYNITSPDGGVSPAFTLSEGFPATRQPPFLDPGINLFGTVWYQPRYAGRVPYFYDWNFTLEQGIGNDTVVRASWQASLGQKLLAGRENLNQVDPRYLALRDLLFVPAGSQAARDAGIRPPWADFPANRSVSQALRPFPQYTQIDRFADADTSGHSTYHAVLLSAERRYSNGLWFLTSYTFSKLISNVQGENPAIGGFLANGDVGTQNAYDRRADKAVSNQDVPHHLVVSYAYELPIGKGKKLMGNAGRVANQIVGGWKVSAVQNYQSGYPLRIGTNLNIGLFSGIRANLNPNVQVKNPAYKGDPNAAPYINPAAFSRPANFTFGNTAANLAYLRSPAILSEDIGAGKDFFFWAEHRRLEFKANFFNIANRTQFGAPNTSVESAAFGRISSQRNRPREVQFSLRLVF